MDRLSILREFISKEQIGVEIGPYYNPITPKREGYRALSLDLLDADALRREAEQDVNIPREAIANIEDVDIVGSACDLEALIALRGLTGQLDFIVAQFRAPARPDPLFAGLRAGTQARRDRCDGNSRPPLLLRLFSRAVADVRLARSVFRTPRPANPGSGL